MALLRLTLACGDYDRTRALRDGTVRVEGVELNYLPMGPEEAFWRMEQFEEFDASEMSMGNYIIERGRGSDRFIAIPVFPSRSFRHNAIYVNTDAGIERPEQLKGKRMGVPEYNVTAAVWVRALLQHDYGVRPEDIRWFQGGLHDPGRAEKAMGTLPPGVRVDPIPPGKTLDAMLEAGELDAVHAPRMPNCFARRSPRVRRLFPDFRAAEAEYYRRTRIFPIMHTIVIRREVYRANPWVAESLYKAFAEAKARCMAALYNTAALPYMLPWMIEEFEAARELMGDDYWAYGWEPNRHVLEAFTQYAYEQGLTPERLPPETLFAPSTLQTYKV
ncbi:MAG TPA: ABC transporter substrate-binding protein [Chloroflexota bacterium]|jgi:4,5-dihydroxyphthalate decarboxylase|nr:ABC transporter substrate-binding protein [Chloroflexota bacterium]